MESKVSQLEKLLIASNKRTGNALFAIFLREAGDRGEDLAAKTLNLMAAYDKTVERALADVLTSRGK